MSEQPSKIDLYSVFVQTIISNETRRQQASAIYLSLISVGVVALGSIELESKYFVLVPIMVVSVIWFLTIRYFRALAKAKFHVIEKLEQDWSIKPFELEWQHVKQNWTWRGLELSNIETYLPIAVFVLVLGYLIFGL